MAGPIRIAVLANASQAKRELDGVAGSAQRIQGRFQKFRVPAALALGGIALGAKKAVDAASDLNEETSKSSVIFGKQAPAIKSWAGTAATALGQSKRQALEAASGFGIIGQKAGLSGTETEAFAKKFTGLSSDLASFNNTSPEEAITAISAAMRGESEPIRKYGVLLDDATLKARAMKMGLIETTTQALTPQQKALAASQEILAQTGKAQGDFARTSDGAANKGRILAAQQENLKATLGQGLLPAYQKVLSVASSFAGVMARHTGIVQAVIVVVAALAAIVLVAGAAQRVYTAVMLISNAATAASAAVQRAATGAALGTRLGLIALAVQTAVTSAVTKAASIATRAWAAVQWLLNAALIANPIGLVIIAIVAVIAVIVIAWKKSETFRKIVIGAWNAIKAATVAVWNAVKGAIVGAWNAIKGAVSAGVAKAKALVTGAWNAVKSATIAMWNGIKTAVSNAVGKVMDIVRGIKGKITGVFSGAAGWLLGIGKKIVQGLIDGIGAMVDKVKQKFTDLTNLIPDWKGPAARDANLLKPAGKLIIGGLVDGLDSGTPKVRQYLRALSAEISTFDASPTVALSASDAYMSQRDGTHTTLTLKLTAQQISQLQRGREIKADVAAYETAGGR